MLDYTQSFQEFAAGLKPTDVALYAGVAIVLYILFKDKLSPVQKIILDIISKFKTTTATTVSTNIIPTIVPAKKEDVFFQLVSSWKQTRDLAVKSGCEEAVKVADQMFPYLSPTTCEQGK